MAALGDLARSDPEGLGAVIEAAFGDRAGGGRGAALVARLAAGGVAAPEVHLAGGDLLPAGVRGAYAAGEAPGEGGAVWLDRGLGGDPGAAGRVLAEELGHHLDAALGAGDAAGDEGAVFAALALGERPSPGALATLRAEDDRGRLRDGTRVEFIMRQEAVAVADPRPDPDAGDPRGRDQVPDTLPDAPGPPSPDPPDDRLSGGGGDATRVSGPGDDALGVGGSLVTSPSPQPRPEDGPSGGVSDDGGGDGPPGGGAPPPDLLATQAPPEGPERHDSDAESDGGDDRPSGSGSKPRGPAPVPGHDADGLPTPEEWDRRVFDWAAAGEAGLPHLSRAANTVAAIPAARPRLARALAGAVDEGTAEGAFAREALRQAMRLDPVAATEAFHGDGGGGRLGRALAEGNLVTRARGLGAIAEGALVGLDASGALAVVMREMDAERDLNGWDPDPDRAAREALGRRALAGALVAIHRPGVEGEARDWAIGRVEARLGSAAGWERLRGLDDLGWQDQKAAVEALVTGTAQAAVMTGGPDARIIPAQGTTPSDGALDRPGSRLPKGWWRAPAVVLPEVLNGIRSSPKTAAQDLEAAARDLEELPGGRHSADAVHLREAAELARAHPDRAEQIRERAFENLAARREAGGVQVDLLTGEPEGLTPAPPLPPPGGLVPPPAPPAGEGYAPDPEAGRPGSTGGPTSPPPDDGVLADPIPEPAGPDVLERYDGELVVPEGAMDTPEFEERAEVLAKEEGSNRPAEGRAGARLEASLGTSLARPDPPDPAIDFVDESGLKIDVKGPLVRDDGGPVTDRMVDGMIKSAIKEADEQSAADLIVVDVGGLTEKQADRVREKLLDGVRGGRSVVTQRDP